MHAHHWKTTAAACALSMLAACGGGDDPAPGPTQTAIGTISSFGSLVVNGVRFDDTAASITMDDSAGTRDRLRVGMVVQVRGRINANGTGVANTIRYNDCVQGPITAMNQVQNTVTVLGQTVQHGLAACGCHARPAAIVKGDAGRGDGAGDVIR